MPYSGFQIGKPQISVGAKRSGSSLNILSHKLSTGMLCPYLILIALIAIASTAIALSPLPSDPYHPWMGVKFTPVANEYHERNFPQI
jgi:hypothetical protein